MDTDEILAVLDRAAKAIAASLVDLSDWGEAGTRPGQYHSDLIADHVGVTTLLDGGFGVLSEETGLHEGGRGLIAVLDPVDGSTNASRRLPWYATSICVVDEHGALAALVVNQATGTRYEAARGKGARRDGKPIAPSRATTLSHSIIGLSGLPDAHLGWQQYRTLGAAALDLCCVADGTLDGYLDCVRPSAHGPWDYLGGMLVCLEAGAAVGETEGRELVVTGHADRRSPVAGASKELLEEIVAAHRHAKDQ